MNVVQWICDRLRHVGIKVGPLDLLAYAKLSRNAGWPLQAVCLLCIHRNWGIALIRRVKKEKEETDRQ